MIERADHVVRFALASALLSSITPILCRRRFLYVGASDLLPEAHRRLNLRVVLA